MIEIIIEGSMRWQKEGFSHVITKLKNKKQ